MSGSALPPPIGEGMSSAISPVPTVVTAAPTPVAGAAGAAAGGRTRIGSSTGSTPGATNDSRGRGCVVRVL